MNFFKIHYGERHKTLHNKYWVRSFYSETIKILSQVLQKNNIKTFIPISNSPLNGMFSIYNNLKFDNSELNTIIIKT